MKGSQPAFPLEKLPYRNPSEGQSLRILRVGAASLELRAGAEAAALCRLTLKDVLDLVRDGAAGPLCGA